MLIQIQEKQATSFGNFMVQVSFDNQQSIEIELKNPHNSKVEKQLEWYFEEYIYEPYTAKSKIEQTKQTIIDYGLHLFKELFKNDARAFVEYKKGLDRDGFEGLDFEISSTKNGIAFQTILWESLRDPEFKEDSLVALGASFVRKSNEYVPMQSKVGQHPHVNLLVVTARPCEENDADYRTIQRPLMNIIRNNSNLKVQAYILRPGTYQALKEHLMEKGSGFYHIIHFDLHGAVLDYETLLEEKQEGKVQFNYRSFGKPVQTFQMRFARKDLQPFEGKKAFLFFETGKKGKAEPTTAKEISRLLRNFRIPVCVLNACQSAKSADTSNETSLGKYLQDEGLDLVLAMRYSVSVTGATQFMKQLYTKLFENYSIDKAITFGRQRLSDNKNRKATLGYDIEMEDWVLPVIYKRRTVEFKLTSLDKKDREANFRQQKKLARYPHFTYGFFGRDLDIWAIEKMLLGEHNHVLVKGMVGVGKSALLKYLAWWWTATQFRNIENAIYFNFEKMDFNYQQFLAAIGEKIFTPKELERTDFNQLILLEGDILSKLHRVPYALLIDQIFEFSDTNIIDFLNRLRGQSFAVYGSVNDENILSEKTFGEQIYRLDGLDQAATYGLAGQIIKKTANKNIQELIEHNKFELEHLLKLLLGFPSAMEAVLPFLKHKSVEQVLEDYREGNLGIL